MIQSFTSMSERVKALGRQRIVVAAAHDEDVLLSISQAARMGIAHPILVGNQDLIMEICQRLDIDTQAFDIIDERDDWEACRLSVRIIREGRAGALMKGLVGTALILKAILNKETGIRDRTLLSHIGLFFVGAINRFVILTDAAMTIAPDLEAKKHILQNAVEAARLLGVENPHAACVCAVETVNPAMQATLDAAELVRLNREGLIRDCTVGGPLALDNALFAEAARHKGITDPVAGRPDILLMPNIEAGNVLYKALAFLCGSPGAGIVLGARAPVILTSRNDNQESKLNSILLALYLAASREESL